MSIINIGGKEISPLSPPFIIAEMSGNHNNDLDRALRLVDAAAECGAHAIKLQTYTADTMTLDCRGGLHDIEDIESPWNGRSLYELYQEASTPWEWHEQIFRHARSRDIICFSTPFDETSVDFLESIGCPAYKIASFEITHYPLIRRAASTGKPLIISTGMATVGEIDDAVTTARSAGCKDIVLMKCTSAYPAMPSDCNIRTISHMADMFQCPVGLSDHTQGNAIAIASIACSATVIEKHFTLSRSDGGVDSSFSIEPDELKSLVIDTERAWQSLGNVTYSTRKSEGLSRLHRRSLYVTADIKAGECFTPDNLGILRPASGASPKYYDILIGRASSKDIEKGTPLRIEDLLFDQSL